MLRPLQVLHVAVDHLFGMKDTESFLVLVLQEDRVLGCCQLSTIDKLTCDDHE